jgi:hypothetical protein
MPATAQVSHSIDYSSGTGSAGQVVLAGQAEGAGRGVQRGLPLTGRPATASGSAGSCSVAAREGPGSGSPGGRGCQGGEELVAPGRVVQDVPGQLLDSAGELGVEVG